MKGKKKGEGKKTSGREMERLKRNHDEHPPSAESNENVPRVCIIKKKKKKKKKKRVSVVKDFMEEPVAVEVSKGERRRIRRLYENRWKKEEEGKDTSREETGAD